MLDHTESHIPYLRHRLKREVAELYVSASIRNFATAMIALFEPLFLYSLGFSVTRIVIFYLVSYLVYVFLLPLGGKIAVRFGFEHSMLYSIPFKILYYLVLYSVSIFPTMIIAASILFAVEKTFYWPAYHSNLAYYGSQDHRGREVGVIRILTFIVTTAGPFLGGLILREANFAVLFVVVSILFFVSVIPMFTTRERFTPGKFSYGDAFKRLVAEENRGKLLGYLGFGEEIIAVVIWPIFIFNLLKEYFSLGVIISLSTLLTIIVMLYIGRLTDTRYRDRVIKVGAMSNFVVWLFRMLARGPFSVLLIDAAARITRGSILIPSYTKTYETASKTTKYMKTVIFFDQSMNLARVMGLVIVLIVLSFTSQLEMTFIPAGLLSFFYMFL
jgi:hypothetical protein